LLPIDVDHQLRIVRGELGEEPGQSRRLVALRDQLLRGGLEILNLAAALIEQLVAEAAELPEALDRRRQKWNHQRARDLAERAEQLTDDGFRRSLLARPILEVLE